MSAPENHTETGLEIAVVGIACRLPGADTPEAFWRNLRDGVESITRFNDAELLAAGVSAEQLAAPNYVKAGAILEAVDHFDAEFFGIGASEASIMDPQHRLFLECAYQALEVAGYSNATDRLVMGIFAGVSASDYVFQNLRNNPRILETLRLQVLFSNDKDYLTTRTAYKLNLRGPAVTVQTACSSGLVAAHLACQSLLSGEVDLALAGGVTVKVQQKRGYVYHPQGGLFSPDGHCRSFDARADGSVFGNGLGVVALRRLTDARADGDVIHAVIKGSSVSNDGSTRVGFTAPGIDGQSRAIQAALRMAEVEPSTVGYVEGHGSGTSLGDPIEVRALQQAFGPGPARTCALGSVKSNFGHLDSAAGIAGLIKTILAVEHAELPPTLHYESTNPKIKLEGSPFYVNDKLETWSSARPRRAGVSSFGVGGTNAHAIVEEAPAPSPSGPSRAQQLLLVSARTPTALETATDALVPCLEGQTESPTDEAEPLADIAFTLATTRRHFPHRRALICRDRREAAQALRGRDGAKLLQGVSADEPRPVAFLFSGLGEQYVDMGVGLCRSERVFREALDACAESLLAPSGVDIRKLLYPAGTDIEEQTGGLDFKRMVGRQTAPPDEAAQRLSRTAVVQPVLFSIGYALAQQWLAWGIRPDAVGGYSIGEYLAACLAGVLSLPDALRVVAARARLMDALPAGAMLGISLPAADLGRRLDGRQLWFAAINDPMACVVAGTEEAVAGLENELREERVVHRRVPTAHAFHTPLMQPAMDAFRDVLAQIALRAPELPMVSNVSGTWAGEEVTDPEYWVRHACEPVRFADMLSALWDDPQRILLEVGPGQTLCGFALQHPVARDNPQALALPSMRNRFDRQPDLGFIQATLAKLWTAGQEPDFAAYYEGETRRKVALPPHPFERQRYWVDPLGAPGERVVSEAPSAPARNTPDHWFYEPQWKRAVLPEAAEASTTGWLLFADRGGLSDGVAALLRARGHRVIVVRPGEAWGEGDGGGDAFTVRPGVQEDHDRLFQALRASAPVSSQRPGRIVHLSGLGPPLCDAASGASSDDTDAMDTGFFSVLAIGQALGKSGWLDPVDMCVVTSAAYDVTGDERLSPYQALALGPCKVVGQEQSNVRCRHIDVTLPTGEEERRELALALVNELFVDASTHAVALRHGKRWVQRFEPVRMASAKPRVRAGGVYLITGGLGRIGTIAGRALAEAGAARLVLTTSAPGTEDLSAARAERIRELEALGALVEVGSADAADLSQMRQIIERTVERHGALHGVIHAAGVVARDSFRTVQESSRADCERHFRPKVGGAAALAGALQGYPLDFCIVVSSISAMLGGIGYAAYAGANAFMDTFARAQRGWLSLNLDGSGFASEEIAEVFRRTLACAELPQIANSATSLEERVAQWSDPQRAAQTATPALPDGSRRPRPDLRNPYSAPVDDLERRVAQIWQEFLFVDRVGVHDNFFELGGTSFIGLQLLSRLIAEFKAPISIATLFAAPSVSTLARVLREGESTLAVDAGADRGAMRRAPQRRRRDDNARE